MTMMRLRVDAPFAAFRPYTAGWFRPTATFLTPSAAYGLLLNIAGIESRLREEDSAHDGGQPTTYTRFGLPAITLAIGAMPLNTHAFGKEWSKPCDGRLCSSREGRCLPRVQTVYQQLHNYPVGASGKERAADTHGNKYNITPVRREYLSGLRAIIAVKTDPETEDRMRRGLAGTLDVPRYGLPFLGDNSFLPDRLEIADAATPAYWYEALSADSANEGVRPHATRMTVTIDRADMSRTISRLFAPASEPAVDPPASAWVEIPSVGAPEPPKAKPRRKEAAPT
jgi:CRISPR-associated protein Cas5t